MLLDKRNEGLGNGIIVVSIALLSLGLVMVASATASPDRSGLGPMVWHSSFGRQFLFAAAGAMLLFLTSRFSVRFLASPVWQGRLAWAAFALALIGLLGAFVPGLADPRRGSHRWLSLAFLGFEEGLQPSEFAKPAIILLIAWFLGRENVDPRSLIRAFFPASIAIGLCVLLVGSEDFGTSSLIAGTGALMLLAGGCRWRYLVAFGGAGVSGMIALIFAEPYRLARIMAFRDIWADPQGGGYQPFQSLTTIAFGGWWGRGLGAGVQKYGYLPEDHTDFIFAIICEEMGVVGAFLVLALFAVMLLLGMKTMRNAASRFEGLLAFGLTVSITLQAVLNVAVVTVLTPTTGISLPLISAGGSGLLAHCLGLGLLAAVARRGRTLSAAAPEGVPRLCLQPALTRSSPPPGILW